MKKDLFSLDLGRDALDTAMGKGSGLPEKLKEIIEKPKDDSAIPKRKIGHGEKLAFFGNEEPANIFS